MVTVTKFMEPFSILAISYPFCAKLVLDLKIFRHFIYSGGRHS